MENELFTNIGEWFNKSLFCFPQKDEKFVLNLIDHSFLN